VDLAYSEDADDVLTRLEADPLAARLLQRVVRELDSIARDPGSRRSRRRSMARPGQGPLWLVPIPGDDDWVIAWEEFGPDEGVIQYIGLDPFG
jgi:hypothetical protein